MELPTFLADSVLVATCGPRTVAQERSREVEKGKREGDELTVSAARQSRRTAEAHLSQNIVHRFARLGVVLSKHPQQPQDLDLNVEERRVSSNSSGRRGSTALTCKKGSVIPLTSCSGL